MVFITFPYGPGLPKTVTSRAFRKKKKKEISRATSLQEKWFHSPDPPQKVLWESPNIRVTSALVATYEAVSLSPQPSMVSCENASFHCSVLEGVAFIYCFLLLTFPHFQLEIFGLHLCTATIFQIILGGLLVTHAKGSFFSAHSTLAPCRVGQEWIHSYVSVLAFPPMIKK